MVTLSDEAVVTLVNEWGSAPRAAARESTAPYPDPAELLPGTAGSTAGLVRVADALHPVFAASQVRERARLIDALLRRTGTRVGVEVHDGALVDRWEPADADDDLLVSALQVVRAMLGARGADALGTCDAHDCVDVWIDRPRGRPRRYCSTVCSGRARAAAFRDRHREEPR